MTVPPGLARAELPADPLVLFERWFGDARRAGLDEPNAMALATADGAGRPAVRMVLLKGFDASGFRLATNYESRKGKEIAVNPRASLLFHWSARARQVRIEGPIERTAPAESDEIFGDRPRGAQLGCWASDQSREVRDGDELSRRFEEAARRFPGPVPRPPHWGGFRVVPERIEFWQGREHRLHDRFCYERGPDGTWTIRQLAP